MELKDLLDFLDISDAKSIDEVKEKFNSKFISKEEALTDPEIGKNITGKITGAAKILLKRLGELENKDIEGKKWEEVAEIAINRYKEKVKDLEGSVGQGTNDEAIKAAQKQIEKLSKERDEYKTAHEALQSTYEKDKTDLEGKLKGVKIGHIMEAAKGKLAPKLKSDMSPAEKIGFDSVISGLIVDFDDKETPYVKDKDGKRLQNPNKAGAFLSLEEAMELKASELNLIKKNTGNGGQEVKTFFTGQQNQNQTQQTVNTGRTLHPNAVSHAERLKG